MQLVSNEIFQGCLVAPTLSIGSILLQQAAISASFHYNNAEIVESRAHATVRHKSILKFIFFVDFIINVWDAVVIEVIQT